MTGVTLRPVQETDLGALAAARPPLAVAAFRRGELRLKAELRWHKEFERELGAGLTDRAAPVRAVGGAPIRVRVPRDGSAQAGDGR